MILLQRGRSLNIPNLIKYTIPDEEMEFIESAVELFEHRKRVHP